MTEFKITGPPGGLLLEVDYEDIETRSMIAGHGQDWWVYNTGPRAPRRKFKMRPYAKKAREAVFKHVLLFGRARDDPEAKAALVRLILGPRAFLGKRPGRIHSLRARVTAVGARIDEMLEMDAVTLLGFLVTRAPPFLSGGRTLATCGRPSGNTRRCSASGFARAHRSTPTTRI